jgi:hypothetical protein
MKTYAKIIFIIMQNSAISAIIAYYLFNYLDNTKYFKSETKSIKW